MVLFSSYFMDAFFRWMILSTQYVQLVFSIARTLLLSGQQVPLKHVAPWQCNDQPVLGTSKTISKNWLVYFDTLKESITQLKLLYWIRTKLSASAPRPYWEREASLGKRSYGSQSEDKR